MSSSAACGEYPSTDATSTAANTTTSIITASVTQNSRLLDFWITVPQSGTHAERNRAEEQDMADFVLIRVSAMEVGASTRSPSGFGSTVTVSTR